MSLSPNQILKYFIEFLKEYIEPKKDSISSKNFEILKLFMITLQLLFNDVGKLGKWFVGTRDAEDETRYKAIEMLEKSEKDIVNGLNMQTSLSKNILKLS